MSDGGPLLGLWLSIQYKWACQAALIFTHILFPPKDVIFCCGPLDKASLAAFMSVMTMLV